MSMDNDNRSAHALALAETCFRHSVKRGGDGTEELLARVERARANLLRERSEAPALEAELRAEPHARQRELVVSDPRFQTWGICELLLDRGLSLQMADPVESGHLADLALAAADRLDRGRHAAPVVEDLKARGWACFGGARLMAGDLAGAESALRRSAACLALGTGDLLVEAHLLEFEAAVRERQGRLGEAASLFKQAAFRYSEIGDAQHLARVQLLRDEILERASGGRGSSRPLPGRVP